MARTIKTKSAEQILHEGNTFELNDLLDLFDDDEFIELQESDSVVPLKLFDHINNLTANKTKWEDLRECDKKSFNNFIITMSLGMHSDLIQFMDELQLYSTLVLTPAAFYKVLYEFLPAGKLYFKYIKSSKEAKYNDDLIRLLANHYNVSKNEAIDYLEIFFANIDNQLSLRDLISKYGKTEKEITKLMEIK